MEIWMGMGRWLWDGQNGEMNGQTLYLSLLFCPSGSLVSPEGSPIPAAWAGLVSLPFFRNSREVPIDKVMSTDLSVTGLHSQNLSLVTPPCNPQLRSQVSDHGTTFIWAPWFFPPFLSSGARTSCCVHFWDAFLRCRCISAATGGYFKFASVGPGAISSSYPMMALYLFMKCCQCWSGSVSAANPESLPFESPFQAFWKYSSVNWSYLQRRWYRSMGGLHQEN